MFLLKARVAPLRAAAASEAPVVWAATGVITVKTTSDVVKECNMRSFRRSANEVRRG